ncbi:MAG: cobalamin B12-binding domain-containing protein [Planctomycetota bacterium]|jgi:methylmalonyl-CoA mutase C-terminal domain/subunit
MPSDKPIRVLVAKPGLDGHDVGAKVVSHALKEAGFEVIYTGLHQSIDAIINAAIEEDVDIIGLSILSGAHVPLTEKLFAKMKEYGVDKKVVIGGNIPDRDHLKLMEIGVMAVLNTGTRFEKITDTLRGLAS